MSTYTRAPIVRVLWQVFCFEHEVELCTHWEMIVRLSLGGVDVMGIKKNTFM